LNYLVSRGVATYAKDYNITQKFRAEMNMLCDYYKIKELEMNSQPCESSKEPLIFIKENGTGESNQFRSSHKRSSSRSEKKLSESVLLDATQVTCLIYIYNTYTIFDNFYSMINFDHFNSKLQKFKKKRSKFSM